MTLSEKSAGAGHRAVSLHRDCVLVSFAPFFNPVFTDTSVSHIPIHMVASSSLNVCNTVSLTMFGLVWFGLVLFDLSASVTGRYHRKADRCL